MSRTALTRIQGLIFVVLLVVAFGAGTGFAYYVLTPPPAVKETIVVTHWGGGPYTDSITMLADKFYSETGYRVVID